MHPVLCTCDRCNHFGNHNKGESMTDRELLELAAKAAGYKIHVWGEKGRENFARMDQLHAPRWNPLTDYGDRYRLAKKLDLNINFAECFVAYFCKSTSSDRIIVWGGQGNPVDDARAIVFAAAEIGKSIQ